jgi:hypothetical protein
MTVGDARLLVAFTPPHLDVTYLSLPVDCLPQPRNPKSLLPSIFIAAFSHAKQTKRLTFVRCYMGPCAVICLAPLSTPAKAGLLGVPEQKVILLLLPL